MFNVSILQSTLAQSLSFLEPTVGKNIANANDDCISMTLKENGILQLFTSNGHESTEVEVQLTTFLAVTNPTTSPFINFKRFKAIIGTIPPNEMVTIIEKNSTCIDIVYANKKPISIMGYDNAALISPSIFSSFTGDLQEVDTNVFLNIFNKAKGIINSSNTGTLLGCIKVSFLDNNEIMYEGVDGATKRTLYGKDTYVYPCSTKYSFTYDVNCIEKFVKSIKDMFVTVKVGADGTMNYIEHGSVNPANACAINSVKYCAVQINGVYPTVAKYYDTQYAPTEYVVIHKQDIIKELTVLNALADSGNTIPPAITMAAVGNEFRMNYKSQYGQFDDVILMNNPIVTAFGGDFNYKNLEALIKNISEDDVEIGMMQHNSNNYVFRGLNSKTQYSILCMASNTP